MSHLFSEIIKNLPFISLADLNASASLMYRKTTKYLVRSSQAIDFVNKSAFLKVLDVSPSKSSVYSSVYYDSSDFSCFFDHLKGRRKRFKVRHRCYDGGLSFLEVKEKVRRGMTQKTRWELPHVPAADAPVDLSIAKNFLESKSYANLPDNLSRSIVVNYTRVTFFHSTSGSRITIDFNLNFESPTNEVVFVDDFCIIEVKSLPNVHFMNKHLFSLGIRPTKGLTKYCIGLLRLNPHLPKGGFANVYRTMFGSN